MQAKEFNILLFGCGNIGNRHLESILKVKKTNKINITIIEKNLSNIKKPNNINKDNKFNIDIYRNLPNSYFKFNLAIIATNSSERLNALKQLKNIKIDYLILEKLLADNLRSLRALDKIINKLKFKKIYINTPRRYMDVYEKIKNKINLDNPLSLNYTATNFKLGSNSIHIIDLFSYLIGDKKLKSLFCNISKILVTNKNFHEFEGILIVSDLKNNLLIINNVKENSKYRTSFGGLKILNYPVTFLCNELNNEIIEIKQSKNSTKTDIIPLKTNFPFQSDLTKKYVENLIDKKKLNLPDYKLSFRSHILCFEAFNSALKRKNVSFSKLKIT